MPPGAPRRRRFPSSEPMPESLPPGSKLAPAEFARTTRHAFLCTGPDCCDPREHADLWDLLKSETRSLGVPVMRTRAACLRICRDGPWLVVYPDGIWYGRLTAERLRHIVREHLGAGRPVTSWIAATMPALAGPASPAPSPPSG